MLSRSLTRGLTRDLSKLSISTLTRQALPSQYSPLLAVLATRLAAAPQALFQPPPTPALSRHYATSKATKKATTKKKKTTTKKKTPAKKKKTSGRTRKKQTPEQAEAQRITRLRDKAIREKPDLLPANPFLVLVTERTRKGQNATDSVKSVSQEYRNQSRPEREHYENVAEQNKIANAGRYSAWVKKFTPAEIRDANNARRALNRLAKQPKPAGARARRVGTSLPIIKDERAVKRPMGAYVFFTRERWASGDFRSTSVTEAARTIGREWRQMSSSDAQKYHDQHRADLDRYEREYQSVYGQRPKASRKST